MLEEKYCNDLQRTSKTACGRLQLSSVYICFDALQNYTERGPAGFFSYGVTTGRGYLRMGLSFPLIRELPIRVNMCTDRERTVTYVQHYSGDIRGIKIIDDPVKLLGVLLIL